jgi:hypothetical protein
MAAMSSKQKFLDIQRRGLLGQLETLMSRLDDPSITPEKLQALRAEVEACQRRFRELGFGGGEPVSPAELPRKDEG